MSGSSQRCQGGRTCFLRNGHSPRISRYAKMWSSQGKNDLYIDTLYIFIHYWYVLDSWTINMLYQKYHFIYIYIYIYWYFILWFPPFVWCRPSPKLVVKEWLNNRKKKKKTKWWRIHRALCVFLPMSSFWQFNIQRRNSPLQMRTQLAAVDLEAARKALEITSACGRAIMLGSAVSPAMYHQMKPDISPKCPWCSCAMATFEHLAWRCRGFPGAGTRPGRPNNFLSWRFAWPTWGMSRSQHMRLLNWLATIQEQLLLLRYGTGGWGRLSLCSSRQTSPWWTSRVTAYVNLVPIIYFQNAEHLRGTHNHRPSPFTGPPRDS